MTLSQSQFDALVTYIDAAIDLAVARADYNQAEHDYSSMGYNRESVVLDKARETAKVALTDPDAG